MTRQANAAALIGTYTAPRASSEAERCPGKCGDVVRFFVGFGGHLEAAPCSTCARLAGKPDPGVPRRTVAEADRDLADVLLFFTTIWREGTSRLQRKRLGARVQWLLERVQLPPLELPAHLVERPPRAAAAPRAPRLRPQPACATCGVALVYVAGRPPKWCDTHRPTKSTGYVKTPAREAAARRAGVAQGLRERRCDCGFVTRGNVAWGMHKKRCAIARGQVPDPAPLPMEGAE